MNLSPDRSGLYLLSSINLLMLHTIFKNEWNGAEDTRLFENKNPFSSCGVISKKLFQSPTGDRGKAETRRRSRVGSASSPWKASVCSASFFSLTDY